MEVRIRRLGLLLLTVVVLAGCGGGAAQPTPTPIRGSIIIGYSAPGLVGAQLDIQQSLERHAKEKGWQLITSTSDGDAAKQNEQIQNMLNLGVSAIVAVPDDSKQICIAVEAAKKANIPFYSIDRSPDGCTINMSVLSDNYLAGQQSAEALVALLSDRYGSPKGKVLEITGNMAQNVAVQRGSGFQNTIQKYAEIVLFTKVGNWDGKQGEQIVREMLEMHPDLDAIYVHSDAVYFPDLLTTLEAVGHLKKRGDAGHIFLAGVDGSTMGIQAIRDGFADQVSSQPIPDFGIVADWIEKELKGESVKEGQVVQEGALWSPATVKSSPIGPQLFLSTTSVTVQNLETLGLWGNQ